METVWRHQSGRLPTEDEAQRLRAFEQEKPEAHYVEFAVLKPFAFNPAQVADNDPLYVTPDVTREMFRTERFERIA